MNPQEAEEREANNSQPMQDTLDTRFISQGTRSEPKGVPDPSRALPSSVNWMRALAIASSELDYSTAYDHFRTEKSKHFSPQATNTTFEHLLLALHQLSALRAMDSLPCKRDVARVGAVAWYYGIYAAATAMVSAKTGTVQDEHAKTATVWFERFVKPPAELPYPFGLHTSTLLKKQATAEIDALRRRARNEIC